MISGSEMRLRSAGPRALIALAATLLAAGVARADHQVGPPERPVMVEVLVVHARQQPGRIDPVCEKLRHRLRLMNFRSLRMVQKRLFKLRMGERGRMQLPAGRRVEFLPISVIDRQLHMQVQMPGVVNTRMRMESGRGVILGGIRHEDGVLVVQLQPSFRLPRPPSAAARRKREARRLRILGLTDADSAER